MIQTPEIVVATWRTAKQTITGLRERRVRECFENFDPLWAELFPAEQVRIIHLLVSRIDVTESGANIVLKVEGLTSLFADLQPLAVQSEAA
jgi:site-specific DNA recombinase